MAPNVLLVVLDTARRDALEPYGRKPGSTPAIAQLASRGRALSAAYATASWTLPSHASMFTGLLPRRLGLGQAPEGTPYGARAAIAGFSDRMLPNVLRRAGYATQAWSTNLWVSPHSGFDDGFDSFQYVTSGRHDRMHALLSGGPRAQLAWAAEGWRSRSDDGAAAVGRGLREAIARWSGKPTFWFVNLSECHAPYLPPRPWNDLPPWDRVRAAIEAKRHLNFEAICLYAAGAHRIPAGALARMRRLHARAASYLDSWLADVLEALDARGILDQTLVIVTSDHGENFGEGGLISHGFSLDQRLIHVPLVMAGPGTIAMDRVVSLAELPTVITRAAEIEREFADDELPQGVAVAEFDPLGTRENPKIQAFARKWALDERGVGRLTEGFTCATDGRCKLVIDGDGNEALYDLEADPEALAPLRAHGANEHMLVLRSALERAAAPATAAPAAASPADGPTADELEALERQMKLLGYM